MIFYRVLNDTVHHINETDTIGFTSDDPSYIPDEYLLKQEFAILRTAHGIGDWGIISAMPRLLKLKYPDCRVIVPSKKLLLKLFGKSHNNAHITFDNNPFVDEFVDSIDGDVFHDQYRIANNMNTDIPLVEQMLDFWQLEEHEYSDSQPEIYWSSDEVKKGDDIIKLHTNGEFGCLLLSDRFGTQRGKYDEASFERDSTIISKALEYYTLPYFYWSYKPLSKTPFNFIKKALDMRHIDIRIQLYIKSKAKVNLSNQCGTNHMVVRYSECIEAQRQFPIKHNFVKGEKYL